MIHVYLDWNVFVRMKNGHEDELLKILSTKDKFFIPYSTAHISDIMSSFSNDEQQLKYIDEDLNFIIDLTKYWCISTYKKEIKTDRSDPKLIFQKYVEDKDYMKGFGLNTITEALDGDELTSGIGNIIINVLGNMPMPPELLEALNNPEVSEVLNVLFPDLKNNPTMGGFFQSFGKMYENFNNSEDWKVVREYSQKHLNINPDRLSNMENPMDFVNALFEQNNADLKKYLPKPVVNPDWYNDITNEYLMLDMFGFFQDRIRVRDGKRKETFSNTTQDAFHCGFAATSYYNITADDKTYNKTKQVYKKLGIRTEVFKPNEFIEHYNKQLNYTDPEVHLSHTINFIQHCIDDFNSIDENSKVYIWGTYLFDMFNTIEVSRNENSDSLVIKLMNCYQPNYVSLYELEPLVNKLFAVYGDDKNGMSEFKNEEVNNYSWGGRCWENENILIQLKMDDGLKLIFSRI